MTYCRSHLHFVAALLLGAGLMAGCDRQVPAESFSVQVRVETEQGEPVDGASVGVRPCYELEGKTVCGTEEVFAGVQQESTLQQARSVELASWSVAADGDAALLTWTTASEMENSGFRIERKAENNALAEIDFVEGAGTTDDSTDYRYRDANLAGGTQYTYRLIAVATDGDTSVVGNPQAVRIGLQPAVALIFPNPFQTRTTLRVQVGRTSTLQSTVYSLDGAQVRTILMERSRRASTSFAGNRALCPTGSTSTARASEPGVRSWLATRPTPPLCGRPRA